MRGSASCEQLDGDGISLKKHGGLLVKVKEITSEKRVNMGSMTGMSNNNGGNKGPHLLLCCHEALLLLQALNCHH